MHFYSRRTTRLATATDDRATRFALSFRTAEKNNNNNEKQCVNWSSVNERARDDDDDDRPGPRDTETITETTVNPRNPTRRRRWRRRLV